MKQSTYRDMHLLDELAQRPETTQRELSRNIGMALGLTNLMLRRLAKKGYVKISGTKRSRIRYLITPQGILEKSRLTCEFIQYSLHLYGRVRHFLREQMTAQAATGHRRMLLYGTGELAEIAFLTMRETGLELVGVVEASPTGARFLEYPVQAVGDVAATAYDRIVVAVSGGIEQLAAVGIPADRCIGLPQFGAPRVTSEGAGGGRQGAGEEPSPHAPRPTPLAPHYAEVV